MKETSEGYVTPGQIAKMWGVTDKNLSAFFERAGVRPVSAFKYGKGVMRMYERSAINMRQAYIDEQEKKAQAIAALPTSTMTRPDRTARIEATLQRIEQKLDVLVKALS
ncbi:MAG: hypothetical protein IPJ62_18170 [Betaproteobacteria bacterium]|nr:hypothetical protein [Betaproteobacteria bacterium]